MFLLSSVLSLSLLSLASACVDGKDNTVTLGDVAESTTVIHLNNVVGQTYDSSNAASCNQGYAQLSLPGTLKLVSGTITVTAASDLLHNGKALLTVKKNSALIGTICNNGKSANVLVTDDDCTVDVVTILGADFVNMVDQPGTYDLAQIEKTENMTSNVIPFGNVPSSLNSILKGEWFASAVVQSNGKTVANFQLPGNAKWIYVS